MRYNGTYKYWGIEVIEISMWCPVATKLASCHKNISVILVDLVDFVNSWQFFIIKIPALGLATHILILSALVSFFGRFENIDSRNRHDFANRPKFKRLGRHPDFLQFFLEHIEFEIFFKSQKLCQLKNQRTQVRSKFEISRKLNFFSESKILNFLLSRWSTPPLVRWGRRIPPIQGEWAPPSGQNQTAPNSMKHTGKAQKIHQIFNLSYTGARQ